MLVGTDRFALLLESATWRPPTGAAAVRVTVQDVLPGVEIEVAVQPRVFKEGETDTTRVPDPLLAGIESAAGEVTMRFVRLIGMAPETPGASWKVAVAAQPLLMPFWFTP